MAALFRLLALWVAVAAAAAGAEFGFELASRCDSLPRDICPSSKTLLEKGVDRLMERLRYEVAWTNQDPASDAAWQWIDVDARPFFTGADVGLVLRRLDAIGQRSSSRPSPYAGLGNYKIAHSMGRTGGADDHFQFLKVHLIPHLSEPAPPPPPPKEKESDKCECMCECKTNCSTCVFLE